MLPKIAIFVKIRLFYAEKFYSLRKLNVVDADETGGGREWEETRGEYSFAHAQTISFVRETSNGKKIRFRFKYNL